MKENENMDKYQDLARELKKLWDMKLMLIAIVAVALRTIPKSLEMEVENFEIRRRINTIQKGLLKFARVPGDLKRVVAQSAGAIECTDRISAEEYDSPNECP